LRDEFVRRDILQNRLVRVETEHEIYEGRAAGIEADGVLLVQTARETRRVVAGDVRLIDEN
jgi:biotin-(acetyl-CoA carboxylase) ligase